MPPSTTTKGLVSLQSGSPGTDAATSSI